MPPIYGTVVFRLQQKGRKQAVLRAVFYGGTMCRSDDCTTRGRGREVGWNLHEVLGSFG